MKNISQVILLSTSCLIWYGADNVCASVNVYSGIPKSGTHNTLHTTPYLAYPHLPSVQSGNRHRHPRASAARPGDPGGNLESLFNLDVRVKPEHDIRVASVCFITDTGNCSGEKFSNDETPGNGGNGNPGSIPDYDTPQEQCQAAGYGVTSCPSLAHGENFCPIDSSYFKICVCDDNLKECHKPYYGVGPSCDGKYASCKRDDAKACKEDGYGQSGACPDLQTPNRKCPYDSAYYDKCVCRSDLVTCSYPQTGVGEACNGKYASCQCPSSYKSCECGGAAGATSCTVNGQTTYSSCKECCEPICQNETNCKYGSSQVSNGCGGYCTICSKNGNYHCSDGSSVPDASMCKNTDGVIIQEDDFCIIISKYQGYDYGDYAIRTTPQGWKLGTLSVMQKASQHIGLINQQLNKIGEPNLLNAWYWTSTIWSSSRYLAYAINPYSGETVKTEPVAEGGAFDQAYYRYYKECD